ncbi:MAG: cytidine/deoxycytidylate deaminase family protein [Candidatus Dojkabacteria bacterium]
MGKLKAKKRLRPSWDEYFLDIMSAVSKRGTCDRGYSACVIVKDKRILTTGYAGSPEGLKHCDEIGHEMNEVIHSDGTKSKHCIRTSHAEQNAIAQAARFGIPIDGSSIYVNMEPCYTCAKILINAGIAKVVCNKRYHQAQRSREVLKGAGVELVVLHDDNETYPDQ